jgi:hypothetical protein
MLKETQLILRKLKQFGLLMKQDKNLPSIVSLVTGESPSTSWWSHPKAHVIFCALSELADHPDVLFTKLLAGKDTLVHRDLWPAWIAIATAKERWQLDGLSSSAKKLLKKIEKEGTVQCSGVEAKELIRRLLVHSQETHTESGKHVLVLESWAHWIERKKLKSRLSPTAAKSVFEDILTKIRADHGLLPWH